MNDVSINETRRVSGRRAPRDTEGRKERRARRPEADRMARKSASKKPRAKKAGPRDLSSLKTALWLLVPPVGLTMMWRRSCRWHPAVKACVSVVMAAALVAILVIPTSAPAHTGGVELVTSRPEVEVYGPDLPSFIVPGYTSEQTDSIIVPAVENDVHYVYAADGAKCYHEYKCKFAFASAQRLTVFEAYYLGFAPCNRCKPPIYDPVTGTITMQEHGDDYNPA